jgi:hypothetical protein
MYSVIIPTLWKSDKTLDLLNSFSKNEKVNEIILIDNDPANSLLKNSSIEKVKVHSFEKNMYVNPSWNFGVENSISEYIMLVNDDIILDTNLLNSIEVPEKTIFGVHESCYKLKENETLTNPDAHSVTYGFGCLMIFQKKFYIKVPNELKIWFGDNFLFNVFQYKKYIKGIKIQTNMSSTSERPEFKQRINKDIEFYNKFSYSNYLKNI